MLSDVLPERLDTAPPRLAAVVRSSSKKMRKHRLLLRWSASSLRYRAPRPEPPSLAACFSKKLRKRSVFFSTRSLVMGVTCLFKIFLIDLVQIAAFLAHLQQRVVPLHQQSCNGPAHIPVRLDAHQSCLPFHGMDALESGDLLQQQLVTGLRQDLQNIDPLVFQLPPQLFDAAAGRSGSPGQRCPTRSQICWT